MDSKQGMTAIQLAAGSAGRGGRDGRATTSRTTHHTNSRTVLPLSRDTASTLDVEVEVETMLLQPSEIQQLHKGSGLHKVIDHHYHHPESIHTPMHTVEMASVAAVMI